MATEDKSVKAELTERLAAKLGFELYKTETGFWWKYFPDEEHSIPAIDEDVTALWRECLSLMEREQALEGALQEVIVHTEQWADDNRALIAIRLRATDALERKRQL